MVEFLGSFEAIHSSSDVFTRYNASKLMKARLSMGLIRHTKECHLAHIIAVRALYNSVFDHVCSLELMFHLSNINTNAVVAFNRIFICM